MRLGFEQASFQPCGEPYSKAWWWDLPEHHFDNSKVEKWDATWTLLSAQFCNESTPQCAVAAAYVEFSGRVSNAVRTP